MENIQPVDKHILIIDDDKSICNLIQKKLERKGFNIMCAYSISEAITYIQQHTFDLVFLDYVLHNATALDMILESERMGLKFPFIVMTGNSDVQVAVNMMKHGALDYLIKDRSLLETLPVIITRVLHQLDTERNLKITQTALVDSENRYMHLIKSLPSMLLIHDQGKFLYANDVLLKVVGKTIDEIYTDNVFNYIVPSYHQLVTDNIATRLSGVIVDGYEIELQLNNERKYVIVTAEIVQFESKNAMLVVLSDITERKTLEIKNQQNLDIQNTINSILKLSQEDFLLQDILDQSFQMILALQWLSFDSKGCIFLFNELTEELYIAAKNNLSAEVIEKCSKIKLGECLCGKAALTQQIQYTGSSNAFSKIARDGMFLHGNYCVPITMAGKLLGVINIYLKENHVRNAYEIEFLNTIANTLASVIVRKNSEASLHTTLTNLELLVTKRTIEVNQKNTTLISKINEVEQGKKELQLNEEKFRLTIEQAVDAIFFGDQKGNFIGINNNASTLTGYSKDELMTMNMRQLFSEEVIKNIPLRYDLLEKGEVVINVRPLIHKNQSLVMVEMKTKKMPDGTYQAFMSNVTQRVETEKNMMAALEKEKELNHLKTRFISVVSHEFRTPLAGVQTSVELLERYSEKWDMIKKKEHYTRIYGNIRYTNLLLDDVSILGKHDSGKLQLVIRPFSIVELMSLVITDVQSVYGTDISINVDIAENVNIVELDETIMRHVLSNIIGNSVKYSKVGNQVIVKIEASKNMLNIIVKDFGIGIPEEDLKHIFEPFHRATNVDTIKGTGLGLAIVKSCIDLMGGNISIDSLRDFGTTINLVIPI